MKCFYCGSETNANGIYCKKCGKRVDGLVECPTCHKLTPYGNFCVNCGAKLEIKDESIPYGMTKPELEESYTRMQDAVLYGNGNNVTNIATQSSVAAPGSEVKPAVATTSVAAATIEEEKTLQFSPAVRNILNWVSFGFAIAAITLCIIFTFFIGYGYAGNYEMTGLPSDLYYVFDPDNWKQFFDVKFSEYGIVGMILATVTTCAIILGIIGTLIYTIIKFVRYFEKKDTNLTNAALVTYFVYVGSIALFLVSSKIGSADIHSNAYFKLNVATTLGLTFSTLCLVTTISTKLVENGICGTIKAYLTHIIGYGLLLLFGCIVLAVIGQGLITLKVETLEGSYYVNSYLGSYPFSINLAAFAINANASFSNSEWNQFVLNYVLTIIGMIGATVCFGLFISFFTVQIKNFVNSGRIVMKKSAFVQGVISSSALIFLGIFLILVLINAAYFCGIENSDKSRVVYTAPVIAIVMGLFMLGTNIAMKIITSNKHNVEQAAA